MGFYLAEPGKRKPKTFSYLKLATIIVSKTRSQYEQTAYYKKPSLVQPANSQYEQTAYYKKPSLELPANSKNILYNTNSSRRPFSILFYQQEPQNKHTSTLLRLLRKYKALVNQGLLFQIMNRYTSKLESIQIT